MAVSAQMACLLCMALCADGGAALPHNNQLIQLDVDQMYAQSCSLDNVSHLDVWTYV